MVLWITVFLLMLGVGVLFWSAVGLGRLIAGRLVAGRRSTRRRRGSAAPPQRLRPADVAVLMAAHQEERVLGPALRAVMTLVEPGQVHVVSDGSTDGTARIAREAGARVLELHPNRGKAGALAAGVEHFDLAGRFAVVMLLDADTHLSPDYLTTGLPLFDEPDVVAVAGTATTMRRPDPGTWCGRFLQAYRERLYVAVQWLLKFGQAARHANVVPIVPGFASMYRSDALGSIDIHAPGLVIEDFNMTFEVHAKSLGRIAFDPRAAVARTQDPVTLRDYRAQAGRWMLGYWQTLRRHGVRPGRFGAAVVVHSLELVASSLFLILLAPLAVVWVLAATVAAGTGWGTGVCAVAAAMPAYIVVPGVLVPDALLTVFAAAVRRRPLFLLFVLGFPLMRVLDAALCLRAIARAFGPASDGTWTSPGRRPVQAVQTEQAEHSGPAGARP